MTAADDQQEAFRIADAWRVRAAEFRNGGEGWRADRAEAKADTIHHFARQGVYLTGDLDAPQYEGVKADVMQFMAQRILAMKP